MITKRFELEALRLERKEGVIKVMVVEIRLSLVEGGIRSGGVENGGKEEKPHYLAFWVPRWFSVQTFSSRSFLFFLIFTYLFGCASS